jgi:hypothetical protein
MKTRSHKKYRKRGVRKTRRNKVGGSKILDYILGRNALDQSVERARENGGCSIIKHDNRRFKRDDNILFDGKSYKILCINTHGGDDKVENPDYEAVNVETIFLTGADVDKRATPF